MTTAIESRRHRVPGTLVSTLCMLAFSSLAFGQQEASIIGQVKDESGAILPGVTISATSPALQVPQVTDVTNQQGEYRLTPLPIGTYAVVYTIQGFQTIRREEVRLTAGFTARMDITLKVGTLNESVTVSGAAPIVDVTSTTTRTELTRETLELIPTSRAGLQSVLMQAPGARTNLDTGSGVTANPTFRAFGRSYEAWVTVEGFPTTSPKSALQSTAQYFDYESFEETSVQTVGNNAETPNSGLNLNVILKSGGNDFHGQGVYTTTAQKLQWDNLDDTLIKAGLGSPNKIATRWDVDAAIGGPILHDKLWFFFTPRLHREDTQIAGSFKPDGTPGVDPVTQFHSTEKVNFQLNPSNKFIGFTQAFHRDSQSGDTPLVPWNSRQHQIYGQQTSKIEWQLVKGNKYVSVQGGEWAFHLDRSGFDPTRISTFDDTTRRASGQNIDASTTTYRDATGRHRRRQLVQGGLAGRQSQLQDRARLLGLPRGSAIPGPRRRHEHAAPLRQQRPDDHQRAELPGHSVVAREERPDVRAGQLDAGAPVDAEPGSSVRPQLGLSARAEPRGVSGAARHHLSGAEFSGAPLQELQPRDAARAPGVGRDGQRQDGGQRRLGTVHAHVEFRRNQHGEQHDVPHLDVPLARRERQQAVRPGRGELRHGGE